MKIATRALAPLPRRRPWRQRRPRPIRREAMVLDQLPLAQIDIYADCVILTRRTMRGAWRSYPVNPQALIQALATLPVSPGLLPEGTIGAGLRHGDPFFVQLVRPHVATLQIESGAARTIRTPMPPLIWAGWRRDYRVFALTTVDTPTPETPLAAAPLPNVYHGGNICWGDVRIQPAAAPAMGPMFRLFLAESQFNSHLAADKSRRQPANVLTLLTKLDADQPYPLDDLRPTRWRLADALSGAIWGPA